MPCCGPEIEEKYARSGHSRSKDQRCTLGHARGCCALAAAVQTSYEVFPTVTFSYDSAPDGQASTWSMICCVVCPSRMTHGRRRGSNTCGSPRAQMLECTQSDGCHTTVISPFE